MCWKFSKANESESVKPHRFFRTRVCYGGLKFKVTAKFKNALSKITD